jgi:predicted transposase YdaD
MAENNNTPNDIKNENDKFFKGMMSLQPVVKDYIRQFVPKNVLDKLDIDTLKLDSASYITDELSEFFSDMVWLMSIQKRQSSRQNFFFARA